MAKFVHKNKQLLHLDLSHMEMSSDQIKKLVPVIRKATSLQAVHLCGNPGGTAEVVEWARTCLEANPEEPVKVLKSYVGTANQNNPTTS